MKETYWAVKERGCRMKEKLMCSEGRGNEVSIPAAAAKACPTTHAWIGVERPH